MVCVAVLCFDVGVSGRRGVVGTSGTQVAMFDVDWAQVSHPSPRLCLSVFIYIRRGPGVVLWKMVLRFACAHPYSSTVTAFRPHDSTPSPLWTSSDNPSSD